MGTPYDRGKYRTHRVRRQQLFRRVENVDGTNETNPIDTGRTVTITELMTTKLMRPQYAINSWLTRGGIALVAGMQNIGKTFFAVSIATAAGVGGGTFLRWRVFGNKRIVYIYHDHDLVSLQNKFSNAYRIQREAARIEAGIQLIQPGNVKPARRNSSYPLLRGIELVSVTAVDKAAVADTLRAKTFPITCETMVIIDDSSIFASQTDRVNWHAALDWASEIQKAGATVIILHHTLKNEPPLWHDDRVAELEAIIHLKPWRNYNRADYPGCDIYFEHVRGLMGSGKVAPFMAVLGRYYPMDEVDTWTTSDL